MAAYVEEVRQGFERWGVSAVHNELAADAPGFYKASPGFIIHNTDAQVPGTYLVMPNDLRDDRIAGPWQNIGFSSAQPGRIPDDMLRIGEDGTVRFVESDAALIGVHDATLPAFTQYFDATVMNPKVLVGAFLGAMAVFVFCALTMQAVGRAAQGMVEEVRRQFREKPGIMAGTEKPDYASPVAISTKAAQREMMLPSILSLVLPIGTGLLLGVAGVLGLLVGTLTTGFCMAVFMANSGGSWDNAKKYIEGGAHGGKGTDPHKAAVVGDTVGDPFKDTSGPSLNILIKLMSMVSIVAAGLIVRYSLVALGVF
jgi:K(+)-stimulated pyrophosphate-energized sodium pump